MDKKNILVGCSTYLVALVLMKLCFGFIVAVASACKNSSFSNYLVISKFKLLLRNAAKRESVHAT